MIYLARHGETEWNAASRIQGHLDSPLTARGEAQARAMGETLAEIVPDGHAMISSPLGRARQTAELICDVAGFEFAACRTDDRLREITWGEWDGLTRAEIEARDPGELARRESEKWNYIPPGGESYEMVTARVRPWLTGVDDNDELIVVCHGTLGRVVRGLYAGLAAADILAMDEPQDAVFRLHAGNVHRIPTSARGLRWAGGAATLRRRAG